MYIDSHAHIATSKKLLDQVDSIITDAKKQKISYIVDSSHDAETSERALQLSRRYRDILLPTIGIHPEMVTPGSDIYREDFDITEEMKRLKALFHKGKDEFVAVGECGLDFYWIERKSELRSHKSELKKIQEEVFRSQVLFAQEVDLPLVVHSRGAESECLRILKLKINNPAYAKATAGKQKLKVKVLFHSYTGSIEIAKKIFEAGYYISFNNIISYPKSDEIRQIFKFGWKKYRGQILSETDAPYLPPQHKRGETCFPSDIRYVVEKMSEISGDSVGTIAKITVENAKNFYSI